jgi:hypothetical protein
MRPAEMDACEAFCIAVKFYRSGEWSPALPARITINVHGRNRTLRQVCSLVEHVPQPLPDSIVSDLFTSLRKRHPRLEKRVTVDRTYSFGAGCLLRLMDESEKAFRDTQTQGDKVSLQRLDTAEGVECQMP